MKTLSFPRSSSKTWLAGNRLDSMSDLIKLALLSVCDATSRLCLNVYEKIYLIKKPMITQPQPHSSIIHSLGIHVFWIDIYSLTENHRSLRIDAIAKAAIQINESQLAKRHYLSNRFDSLDIDDLNWTVWFKLIDMLKRSWKKRTFHGWFSTILYF